MAAYPYQPYQANVANAYGNPYNPVQTQYPNTYAAQTTIAPQAPVDNLIRVTGIDGAKAYQLPPNSSIALFDSNNDIMYIKTTDGAGFPSIRSFSFTPIDTAQTVERTSDYVQRPEFDELVAQVKELINAQQPVQQSSNAATKRTRQQSDKCDQ